MPAAAPAVWPLPPVKLQAAEEEPEAQPPRSAPEVRFIQAAPHYLRVRQAEAAEEGPPQAVQLAAVTRAQVLPGAVVSVMVTAVSEEGIPHPHPEAEEVQVIQEEVAEEPLSKEASTSVPAEAAVQVS